jgi:GNAT superfamily N-acetyltransferase
MKIELFSNQFKYKELLYFIDDNLKLLEFSHLNYNIQWIKEKDIKENTVFIATNNNKLIGCIILNKNNIEILCVDKSFRNKKIGKELINTAEHHLENKNFNDIFVETYKGFNAKEFYKKNGYFEIHNDECEHTFRLRKIIKSC